MQRKNTFVALTDADGCIFNPHWFSILLYVIANHGSFLYKHGRYPEQTEAVTTMVETIIAECEAALESMPPRMDMIKTILFNQGYPDMSQLDQEDRDAILLQTQNYYVAYIHAMGEAGQRLLGGMLQVANKPYFNEVIKRVTSDQIDNFLLLSGSNRQSHFYDIGNGEENGTGSFAPVLMSLSIAFNSLLSQHPSQSQLNCMLDKFLLADIFGELETGTSFDLILNEVYKKADDIFHHDYAFDRKKFSLLYVMMHYLASHYPNDNITLAFFEDMPDIYRELAAVYTKHLDLIPHNLVLEFWPYDGDLPKHSHLKSSELDAFDQSAIFILQGRGNVDYDYARSLLQLVEMAGFDEDDKPVIDCIVDLQDAQLEQFKRERFQEEMGVLTAALASGLTLMPRPQSGDLGEALVERQQFLIKK